ncbi:amidase signature enzyme [Thelephora ganbajun]|uniref:Amidase signature enzyme n=1 Tax=Thelephora ganbajun TaxID=370292 RepID=A0ACB6Z342_THEGA|nr:amidase signature enzyme [Thelephora ganbajun]
MNCVTGVMFSDALRTASEPDAHFTTTKELKGPLHGVPISFKDLIDVKGYDSSMGFSPWANNPAPADADLVRQVREAGGIPLVKTNVPQNLANSECSNPPWDTTKNPHDAKYIPGGSSEGEGALLAVLEGSAYQEQWVSNSPTHQHKSHGVFTPSADPNPGFKSIPTVLGPMARTIEDIEIASRVVFGKSANYSSAPVPYRQVKLGQKLKFGYYFDDGMARITPACHRAVCETVEAPRKQGHESIEFELPTLRRCPRHSYLSHRRLETQISSETKAQTQQYGMGGFGCLRLSDLFLWEPNLELACTYIPRFLHAMLGWYLEKVDPTKRGLGCPWFRWYHWSRANFTYPDSRPSARRLFYSLLDCPVGSIPVTRVDPELDASPKDWLTTTTSDTPSPKEMDKLLYGKKWGFRPTPQENRTGEI